MAIKYCVSRDSSKLETVCTGLGVLSADLLNILQLIRREMGVWKRLTHPNVHGLCGIYFDPHRDYLPPGFVSLWSTEGHIMNYLETRASEADIDILKLTLVRNMNLLMRR